LEEYCIALPKPKRKTILVSYCNNILNHGTKGFFKKKLFYAQYNMPYILIQVNESVEKKFTLKVGHLNKAMEFKCNIYIIMGYSHSP